MILYTHWMKCHDSGMYQASLEERLQHGKSCQFFSHTFIFADVDPVIHSVLQHIHDVVLEVIPVAYPTELHEIPVMQSMME